MATGAHARNIPGGSSLKTGTQALSTSEKSRLLQNLYDAEIASVSPRCFHTGGNPALQAADGVNSTPVVTEIYVAEIYVDAPVLVTGVAVFNGSDSTNKIKIGLFDVNGVLLRSTAAAGTQLSGTDAYQRVPFALDGANVAATTIQLQPGTYYVGCIHDGTTTRFNAHGVGTFGGGKITGAVFSTAFNTTSLTITPPTAFVAAELPPIASLY